MRSFVVVICASLGTHVYSQLLRCDTAKIAITSEPFLATSSADSCGAAALGGKSIRSIFETSATSPDTIAKMVNTPSCQTWWKELSAPFASFKPCTYLGMTIQDFSKLSLQAFLEANNKEIQSFDLNRPVDMSPIETEDITFSTDNNAGSNYNHHNSSSYHYDTSSNHDDSSPNHGASSNHDHSYPCSNHNDNPTNHQRPNNVSADH